MAATPPSPGITTAPAAAPLAPPVLPVSSATSRIEIASPWPPSAQRVTVGLLLAALGLLGWHAVAASNWMARPTTLQPAAAAFQVDLNRADHAKLLQLPGVGPALAQHIEDFRDQYGDFQSVDDLRRVSGIGPATLERLRPFVYVQANDDPDEGDRPRRQESERIGRPKGTPAKPIQAIRPSGKKAEGLAGAVDVNRATAEELQRLPGVGPAMSARIVAAREEKAFLRVEDLRRVHGIGPKTLERLRPFVSVGMTQQATGAGQEGE